MEKKQTNIFDDIMITGMKLLCIGRSGAGKTYTMFQILYYLVKKHKIDVSRIIIFSKTFKSDPTQQKFIKFAEKIYQKKPEVKQNYSYISSSFDKEDTFERNNCSEQIHIPFLIELFDSQKKKKDQQIPIEPWLIIFDDQISEEIIKDKNSPLIDLATIGRHYLVHSCWLLQSYRSSIAPIIRRQSNIVLIGHMMSDNDVLDILEEFSAGAGQTKKKAKENMFQFYQDAIHKQSNHGMLQINGEVPYSQGRIQLANSDQYYDY